MNPLFFQQKYAQPYVKNNNLALKIDKRLKIIKAVMGLNPVSDLPGELVLKQAPGVNNSSQVIANRPEAGYLCALSCGLVLVSSRGERR
ncbi:hypothetical protein C8R31_10277 [Nitrosospira sp. Nsp2]|nr:hypothetical protein C8R31_10277 [Nitrosospira sp. Nsp2]